MFWETTDLICEIAKYMCLQQRVCSLALVSKQLAKIMFSHTQYIAACMQCNHLNRASDAALHGHLVCLRWFTESGYLLDDTVCKMAARNGHLHCLRYAYENRYPWDEHTCTYAAENGHLSCLQYARENGCPWTVQTFIFAANAPNALCLQYAHVNECSQSVWASRQAAMTGRLHNLKYIVENGLAFDSMVLIYARQYDHPECVAYAEQLQFSDSMEHDGILLSMY